MKNKNRANVQQQQQQQANNPQAMGYPNQYTGKNNNNINNNQRFNNPYGNGNNNMGFDYEDMNNGFGNGRSNDFNNFGGSNGNYDQSMNGMNSNDFMNPNNMANFAMIAQKMLQTAMQMQMSDPSMNPGFGGNDNMYDDEDDLDDDYGKPVASFGNSFPNGNKRGGMGMLPVPQINPAIANFNPNMNNGRQANNFAANDFDGE